MIDGAIHVIPTPSRIRVEDGTFSFRTESKVFVDKSSMDLWDVAQHFVERVAAATGVRLDLRSATEGEWEEGGLVYTSKGSDATQGSEAYVLDVGPDAVKLAASAPAGAFYATQTLRQLLPSEIERCDATAEIDQWVLPAVRIHDAPRFGWRGMLLDCCRHFMTVGFVKRYIDLLAFHKFNRFHWHLTEDQGWRVEVDEYPRLTEIGAWRTQPDGTKYGGYYTKTEIRQVVEYAHERHVTVVPEIEMPGHALAALASYPEFSCKGGPFEVASDWGIFEDVYCVGKDATFTMLEDVLTEVMELFPSEYIHIGGDECPKRRWKSCERCQQRIEDEGLKDEYELQSYFLKRIASFLHDNGRKLIGWDEILEGGLAPSATVQSWSSVNSAFKAVRLGHDTILSPTSHCYFDFDLGTTDLKQVYSFDPIPAGLDEDQRGHVLGGECNMWTERAPQETVDQKVFPRLVAMAECLWSQLDNKDFSDFRYRLKHHYQHLQELGVDYGAESAASTE